METSLKKLVEKITGQNKIYFSSLIAWMSEIAEGMGYLDSKKYHHGDLRLLKKKLFDFNINFRAANILIRNNEIKIGSFTN